MSKAITLAGAPSIPLRNSGKQTRNILLFSVIKHNQSYRETGEKI